MKLKAEIIEASIKPKPLVLAVDDSRTQLALIVDKLGQYGYKALQAENGAVALEIIEANAADIDAIILDREMPIMDGMALIRKLKATPRLRRLPVVMLTGLDRPDQVSEGIAAGVFYYLTKPLQDDVFGAVLSAAITESRRGRALGQELQKHRTAFSLLNEMGFTLRTLEQAEDTASFLANAYPRPERVVNGLAELLINAIEHGNLELGHIRKAELLQSGGYQAELTKRAADPHYASRHVQARFVRAGGALQVTITDQGQGFDWQRWLRFDPSQAGAKNGRGIAQAHLIGFDTLVYNQAGNSVTATIRADSSNI